MNSLIYDTGTVSVAEGSAIVEGALTGWAVALVQGGIFSCGGTSIPIASVEDDTHLTLAYPWPGEDAGGVEYAIARMPSEATARAATWTLDRLAKLAQTPWGVGVVPDARGTLAERNALDPMPMDDFCWLRVEVDEPAELYFRVSGQWVGPYPFQGEAGPAGRDSFNVQVDELSDRDEYDGEQAGFRVLVSDIGDGTAAIYSRVGAAGWSNGAPVIGGGGGGSGDVTAAENIADGTAVVGDGGGKGIKSAGYKPREVLTANRTYYIRTDGSNANDGLANTPEGAFATIQTAVNAALALDFSTYNVVIQIGAGTYSAGATLNGGWVGAGTLTIRGDISTPSNVHINATSAAINVGGLLPAFFYLEGLKLSSATNSCISHGGVGQIRFSALEFGSAALRHISIGGVAALIRAMGPYSISAGAQVHWMADNGAYIQVNGTTISFLDNVTFAHRFANSSRTGGILCNSNTFNLNGFTVTGQRYLVGDISFITTAGGGASYLPGSSAGAVDPLGSYN